MIFSLVLGFEGKKIKNISNYPGCQVQARPGAIAVVKESNS